MMAYDTDDLPDVAGAGVPTFLKLRRALVDTPLIIKFPRVM